VLTKSLIVIAVFAALGVFAYGPRTAPAPQIATQLSTGVDQVSPLDEVTEPVQLGCTGNCCEFNDAGICILCRKVAGRASQRDARGGPVPAACSAALAWRDGCSASTTAPRQC
jgi:hypothetical protein